MQRFQCVLAAALVVAGFVPAAYADERYDPLAGMDADGRIPKVEKAAYVDHPERWRYLPCIGDSL